MNPLPVVVVFGLMVVLSIALIALMVAAMMNLRHRKIDEISRVLWAWMILTLPLIGAITFFIVSPGSQSKNTN